MNRRRFTNTGLFGTAGILQAMTHRLFGVGPSTIPDYATTGAQLIRDRTPREDGFTMPAEEDRHLGTIMAFVPPQNWKGHGLEAARKEWATVANTIAQFEPVTMVVDPDDEGVASRLLSSKVEQIPLPLNDGWARDTGPVFLKNRQSERRIAGFTFNGWGAKFPPYRDDALLKARLAAHYGIPMYVSPLVLEGGGVLQDGAGTLIVTEQCLLHRNRNPGRSKAEVEKLLLEYLGAEEVIWLSKGLTPDPVTDGHIDGIAAYARPGVVLLHTTPHRSDPNYRRLQDAKRRLSEATDARGQRLEIIELPLADEVAHMNFFLCNGAVIVPIQNDPRQDEPALEVLRDTFPDRKVIGVSGVVLSKGGGGVHCITQQIPA